MVHPPNVDLDGTTGYDTCPTTAKWKDLYPAIRFTLITKNQDDPGTTVKADVDQGLTVKTEGTGIIIRNNTNSKRRWYFTDARRKEHHQVVELSVGFGDKIPHESKQSNKCPINGRWVTRLTKLTWTYNILQT